MDRPKWLKCENCKYWQGDVPEYRFSTCARHAAPVVHKNRDEWCGEFDDTPWQKRENLKLWDCCFADGPFYDGLECRERSCQRRSNNTCGLNKGLFGSQKKVDGNEQPE